MFREAVENLIDDVKDSIEEQGRHAGRPHSQFQPPPMPTGPRSAVRVQPPGHDRLIVEIADEPTGHHPEPPPRLASVPGDQPERSPVPAPASAPAPSPVVEPPRRVAPKPRKLEKSSAIVGDVEEPVDGDAEPADSHRSDHAPKSVTEEEPPVDILYLEDEVDVARDLFREARQELREARRTARLEARDRRRNQRYDRKARYSADAGR